MPARGSSQISHRTPDGEVLVCARLGGMAQAERLGLDDAVLGLLLDSELDGLLGAILELRAESRVRAGDRAADAELDLCIGHAGEGEDRAERNAAQQQFLHVMQLPCID